MVDNPKDKVQAGATAVVRELTAEEVEFTLEVEDEHIPVEGHFATDEPELDRKQEQEILSRLRRGDTWAWCCVKVTAKWKNFTGVDYLGCCSYEDEEDFKQEGGYWEDMKSEALDALNKKIAETAASLSELASKGCTLIPLADQLARDLAEQR